MQVMTICGKLGRDAELRSTNSGDQVCSFSVAVDQRNGRDKTTNWYRVSIWGKRGEVLQQYLTKGAAVTVVGEFSVSEYEGKTQLNIRASEIALQGGRNDDRREPDDNQSAPVQTKPVTSFADDLSDEIPF